MSNWSKNNKTRRSGAVYPKLKPKPFLCISRPPTCLSDQKAGKTQGWFAPTFRTNHRAALRQSNVWDHKPVTVCSIHTSLGLKDALTSCLFYALVPHLTPRFLFSCSEDYAVFNAWKRIVCSLNWISFTWRMSVSGCRHKLRNSTQNRSGHYTKEIK